MAYITSTKKFARKIFASNCHSEIKRSGDESNTRDIYRVVVERFRNDDARLRAREKA